jgi:hypothetical protein
VTDATSSGGTEPPTDHGGIASPASALLFELTGHTGETEAVAPEPAPRRGAVKDKAKKTVAAGVVGALLIASAVILFLATNKSNADAAVSAAVTSSLSHRTAVLGISGSVQSDGTDAPIVGFGQADFTKDTMQVLLKIGSSTIGGNSVTENADYLDNVIYLNMGELVGRVLPGKSWLSMDLARGGGATGASGSLGVDGGSVSDDPLAILSILGQSGNTAVDLGSSVVSGQRVEGYSVTVQPGAIRSDIAREHLPSWMRESVTAVSDPRLGYRIYVDQAGLVQRMTTGVSLEVSGHRLTETISMDFSKYGSPVSIAVPPAGQVATFGTFLQAAQTLAGESAT